MLGDADLAAGRLRAGGYTALVVAGTRIPDGSLSAAALAEVRAFVTAGGTYVGVRRPGLAAARAAALTTAAERSAPTLDVPGATFAVTVDRDDPVAWGSAGRAVSCSTPATRCSPRRRPPGAALRRPGSSGYARDAAVLGGTPAVLDATVGAGRVVLFAGDPSFRAYADGAQRLLANALLAPPLPPAAARTRTR